MPVLASKFSRFEGGKNRGVNNNARATINAVEARNTIASRIDRGPWTLFTLAMGFTMRVNGFQCGRG